MMARCRQVWKDDGKILRPGCAAWPLDRKTIVLQFGVALADACGTLQRRVL